MTPFSNRGGEIPESNGSPKIVTAAVLGNATEAELLRAVLAERGIPNVLVTHDRIWGEGLFMVREGWGHIEAPENFLEEIEEICGDLFPGSASGDPEAGGSGPED